MREPLALACHRFFSFVFCTGSSFLTLPLILLWVPCFAQGGSGRSGQSGQGAAAGGQGASGLLGALAQSIGPMMQQLMVGDGHSSASAQGPTSSAPMRSSSADWKSALSELDGEEQAEWERVIRLLYHLLSCPTCMVVLFRILSTVVIVFYLMSLMQLQQPFCCMWGAWLLKVCIPSN